MHPFPQLRDFGVEAQPAEQPFGLVRFLAASIGQGVALPAAEVSRPRGQEQFAGSPVARHAIDDKRAGEPPPLAAVRSGNLPKLARIGYSPQQCDKRCRMAMPARSISAGENAIHIGRPRFQVDHGPGFISSPLVFAGQVNTRRRQPQLHPQGRPPRFGQPPARQVAGQPADEVAFAARVANRFPLAQVGEVGPLAASPIAGQIIKQQVGCAIRCMRRKQTVMGIVAVPPGSRQAKPARKYLLPRFGNIGKRSPGFKVLPAKPARRFPTRTTGQRDTVRPPVT